MIDFFKLTFQFINDFNDIFTCFDKALNFVNPFKSFIVHFIKWTETFYCAL